MKGIGRLLAIIMIAIATLGGTVGMTATPATAQVIQQDPDIGTSEFACGRAYIPTLKDAPTTELSVRNWAQLTCNADGTISVGQWLLNTPGDTADKQAAQFYVKLPAGQYEFFGQIADVYDNATGTRLFGRGNNIPFTLNEQTELVIVYDAGVGAGFYISGRPTVAPTVAPCDVTGTDPNETIISEGPALWTCYHRDQFREGNFDVSRIWQGGLMPEGLGRHPFLITLNITDTGVWTLNSQRGFFLPAPAGDPVIWDNMSPWALGNGQQITLQPGRYLYVAYPQNGGAELVRRTPIQVNPPTSGRVYLPLILKAPNPCEVGYIEAMGRRFPLNSSTAQVLPHLPWNAPIVFTVVGPTSGTFVQYQPYYWHTANVASYSFPSGRQYAGKMFSIDIFTVCGHVKIDANIDP